MKLILFISTLLVAKLSLSQGKFFGGNGDGFATATISNIVLPSTGLVFNGASCGEGICLTWSTQQEFNTSYFDIGRQTSATQFELIGRVAAAGTSNVTRNYSFIDKWPLDGINYYRLTQADRDGRFSYSSTLTVAYKQMKLAGIVTNFSPDQLVIRVLQPLFPLTLSILDMQGRLVLRSVHSSSTITADVSNLPGGMYLVTIAVKGKKEQHKFMKPY
jgi:hypothetical protein